MLSPRGPAVIGGLLARCCCCRVSAVIVAGAVVFLSSRMRIDVNRRRNAVSVNDVHGVNGRVFIADFDIVICKV